MAEALGRPPILALTATAAPPVRAEIVERLGLRDPLVVVRGFDRPNISLAVERFTDAGAKRAALLERVAEVAAQPGVGIVYAATRRIAEEVAEALTERGVRAEAYHGGLPASRRREVEAAFTGDHVDVVVATTAFGMGIDKPDVRFVYHHDVADSPDSYYQEIGRAGRDGEPAEAVLFYRPEDLGLRRFFAGAGGAGPDDVAAVADAGPGDVEELVELTGLPRARVTAALSCLDDGDDGESPAMAAARAHDEREARARIQQSRVGMRQAYAEARGCRREVLQRRRQDAGPGADRGRRAAHAGALSRASADLPPAVRWETVAIVFRRDAPLAQGASSAGWNEEGLSQQPRAPSPARPGGRRGDAGVGHDRGCRGHHPHRPRPPAAGHVALWL